MEEYLPPLQLISVVLGFLQWSRELAHGHGLVLELRLQTNVMQHEHQVVVTESRMDLKHVIRMIRPINPDGEMGDVLLLVSLL